MASEKTGFLNGLDDLVGVMVGEEEVVEEVIHAEEAVAGEEDGGVLDVE